jgi:hypothetical protein
LRVEPGWINAVPGAFAHGGELDRRDGRRDLRRASDRRRMALCPHIGKLIDALNKAGTHAAMTARDNGTLMITGDRLKAIVPCIPGDDIPPSSRSERRSDRIRSRKASRSLLPLMKLEAERIVEISLLLRNNSMFSCNGQSVIFEYWHGIDLPPWGMALPKPFVQAIAKQTKKLTGFGFSERSVTMYFEDGAWIKTQLYDATQWPDVGRAVQR